MGDQLVTDSSPNAKRGGCGYTAPAPLLRYTETFEEMCPYYMSLGMTYEEYWDGDNELPKYFRQKEEYDRERESYSLWLNGLYIYEALLDVHSVFNPFNKKPKPVPYREFPIPVTKREVEKQETEKKKNAIANGKAAMKAMAEAFNKKFKRKE